MFKVWSKQHKLMVNVYGVWQSEFLVWTIQGWGWVKQNQFTPSPEASLTYKNSTFYSGQRPEGSIK